MNNKIKLSKYLTPIFETPMGTGSWFGYYNYDTLNQDQTKMLSNRTKNDAKEIEKGMSIEVGYYDIPSGEWHHIGTSDSYNWQQGCMAQWLPGDGNDNRVIYNTSDGKHNIAKIVNTDTLEEKIINWSIYGLTPDGKKSISLLFERSHWCRAYHYESIADEKYNVRVAEDDGVFEIDLENNSRKRIVSIQDVINTDKEPYFDKAKHWLEHIMVSPGGKRFCFLHRFTIGTLDDYETRLFIADIDGSNLQIIDGWRDFYWSHFGWNGDDAFTIYSYISDKHNSVLNRIGAKSNSSDKKTIKIKQNLKFIYNIIPEGFKRRMKRVIKGPTTYYQYYKYENNSFVLVDNLTNILFDIDGHPSFTKDMKYMITDSYPDNHLYRRLIVYNRDTKKAKLIGKLYAGLYNKPGKCDLHPKLCKNNNYLVVDTAYDGQHHMFLFKIDWDLVKGVIG